LSPLFATTVVDTGGNLPPALLTPAEIFCWYHWHQWQICHPCQKHKRNLVAKFAAGVVDTGGKFATGVNNTREHLDLQISPRILKKIWINPNVIFRGLGECDSWKKTEAKNTVTLSL
jgi:hypothetical protein